MQQPPPQQQQQQSPGRVVRVARPKGAPAGAVLTITFEGASYNVTVPPGVAEGGLFEANIPLPQRAAQYAQAVPEQAHAHQPHQPIATPVASLVSAPEPPLYGLPPGWEEKRAPDGRRYFANHNTKQTTWDAPSC